MHCGLVLIEVDLQFNHTHQYFVARCIRRRDLRSKAVACQIKVSDLGELLVHLRRKCANPKGVMWAPPSSRQSFALVG